jgi:hypothetical protein
LLLLLTPALAFAQGTPSPVPTPDGSTVPTWVFLWTLGLSTFFGAILLLVIRILWSEARKKSGLSEEERNQLALLYEWHNQKDDNQVPLWYTPRSWLELFQSLRNDHGEVKQLLTRLVDLLDHLVADLRAELKESRGSQAQQQTKMLKLAVRVQRAVEALAGLNTPEIEADLDDDPEAQ